MKRSIVCRCEDISEEDVLKAIRAGYTDLEELRKKLRIGMGPCQGRVCVQIVAKILEKETGFPVGSMRMPTVRSPLVPVSLGALASEDDDNK
jgi:bacterioferritin-associated ferredoxin